jgi:NADH-quinone oxidoreductase subunit L
MGWPPEEGWIHDFLEPNFHHESAEDHAQVAVGPEVTFAAQEGEAEAEEGHHVSNTQIVTFGVISTIVAVGGWMVAYGAYARKVPALSPEVWAARFGGLYRFIYRKWMLDELYETFIVHPLYVFSQFLWQIVDVRIIDGTVNGVAGAVGFTSSRLRRVQTGFVANYALAIALGAVIIIGAFFVLQSDLFA